MCSGERSPPEPVPVQGPANLIEPTATRLPAEAAKSRAFRPAEAPPSGVRLQGEAEGWWPCFRTVKVALFFLLLVACGSDRIEHSPLPERTDPPDTTALTEKVRTEGGAVLIELTGWASSDVIDDFVEAGLRPLPGYERVERLDSMGLNVVGGTVSPEALDRILQFSYIVSVRTDDANR